MVEEYDAVAVRTLLRPRTVALRVSLRMQLFFHAEPINSRHANTVARDGGGGRGAAMELQLYGVPGSAGQHGTGSAPHPVLRSGKRRRPTLVSSEGFTGYSGAD